ncbi:MAG: HEAT repeat domain-containing protein, partial [Gammaproteobacteria bacterium]|nr:HEAT repeat domain-containing protein [Gammaproteobacteria bacterium]
ENISSIVEAVERCDESSVSFAQILLKVHPEVAVEHILPAIKQASPNIADLLLDVIATTNHPAITTFLLNNHSLHDNHFHASAMEYLASVHCEEAKSLIHSALNHADPRIRATAIHCILNWPLPESLAEATDQWMNLLDGTVNEKLAALELIPTIKHIEPATTLEDIEQACLAVIVDIFPTQNNAAKVLILNACRYWQGNNSSTIHGLIIASLEHIDPSVRAAAVWCIPLLPIEQHYNKLEMAMGDGHIQVRNAAVDVLRIDTPDATQLALKWIIEDNRGTPRAQETLLNAVIDAIPKSKLELIIDNKIKDAQQIHKALLTLYGFQDKNNSALKLLHHLLEERLQKIVEIALTAMQPLCADNVISVIRAGMRTLDERHIANACEALSSIPDQTLIQPLSELIQDAFMPSQLKLASTTENVEIVLQTLMLRPDTWLQQCASSALLTLRKNNNG